MFFFSLGVAFCKPSTSGIHRSRLFQPIIGRWGNHPPDWMLIIINFCLSPFQNYWFGTWSRNLVALGAVLGITSRQVARIPSPVNHPWISSLSCGMELNSCFMVLNIFVWPRGFYLSGWTSMIIFYHISYDNYITLQIISNSGTCCYIYIRIIVKTMMIISIVIIVVAIVMIITIIYSFGYMI